MPVNIVLTAADQRWILADAEATVIVVDAVFAPRVAALLPDLPLVETVDEGLGRVDRCGD